MKLAFSPELTRFDSLAEEAEIYEGEVLAEDDLPRWDQAGDDPFLVLL